MSSGGGGQSSPSSTTTVQKSDPWEGQQPYLTHIFGEAQKQYTDTANPQYYNKPVTAAIAPETQQAQASLTQAAGTQGIVANNTAAANNFNMTDARDVNTNPYLQRAIQAAINPMVQNFNDAGGVMSNIRTDTQQNQSGGGSRQGIAEGIAASRLNQQIGDVAATMANQGYQSGLDASTKAIAVAPSVQGMLTAPAQTLDAVGQQKQGYEQQAINDAIDKWNWEQNLPAAKLSQYQNLVQGNYGGTSSGMSTGTTPASQRNPIMGALGGAAAGMSLAGPWGAAAGALLSFL